MSATDWIGEYEKISTDGGVITLRFWTQVQLTGNDRVKLLHNMCTNDIRRIEAGQVGEAFLLDVKGKIVAHLLVAATFDSLHLLTVAGQAERIINHLDRYVIREDVQLSNAIGLFDWHLVIGAGVENLRDKVGFMAPCELLWPHGWLMRTQKSEDASFAGLGGVDTESPVWQALRVESFFPLYGVDFDSSHLPQEINRDRQAISFSKGCYLGQETVARIDALGHVNRKLTLVKFRGEKIPNVGGKLLAGEHEVGTVTSSTWSPRHGAPIGMALVKRGWHAIGTSLTSEFAEAEIIDPAMAAS